MMQQKRVSCGLACAAMAEVYMKSQVQENMEAVFRQISQKFPENFQEDRTKAEVPTPPCACMSTRATSGASFSIPAMALSSSRGLSFPSTR